jgi:hypothetical protein
VFLTVHHSPQNRLFEPIPDIRGILVFAEVVPGNCQIFVKKELLGWLLAAVLGLATSGIAVAFSRRCACLGRSFIRVFGCWKIRFSKATSLI